MKTKLMIAAALAGLGLAAAAPASAQTVDQRHWNEQHRIHQGERSGQLTYHEARRLEHQQHSIDRQEARMRYRNGGYLTPRERAHLQARESRASAAIYRAKHNFLRY